MRLLLDTHVLLWALAEPDRLSAAARDALTDGTNDLFVSSVSLFEVSTKHRLGKLPTAPALLDHLDWNMARLSARYLPLEPPETILAGALPGPHRDPFDRLLAAQAQVQGMPLVTSDQAFQTFAGVQTLW